MRRATAAYDTADTRAHLGALRFGSSMQRRTPGPSCETSADIYALRKRGLHYC